MKLIEAAEKLIEYLKEKVVREIIFILEKKGMQDAELPIVLGSDGCVSLSRVFKMLGLLRGIV